MLLIGSGVNWDSFNQVLLFSKPWMSVHAVQQLLINCVIGEKHTKKLTILENGLFTFSCEGFSL